MTTTISILHDAIELQKLHRQDLEKMRDRVQSRLELAIDLDGHLELILADIDSAIRECEEEIDELEEQKKELEANNSG
ncbi:uncharacterized protein J7T54_003780 [Emericellopsis cladophorae]|uniref:Uncharacterized protein n=1 Tax=Emericellopsis cladophorae TaxID=2686198 RepID=A0A9P9XUX2_9HYPO|nr:uncharacterized protein J7T54_003780 [Emericellopsis cladophorae]KAI6778068.1 hypothetical protein J7T54_003780 [Emericellopsis cladophorae]